MVKMTCTLCGKEFGGYCVTVCDACMDKQMADESWDQFLARMKPGVKTDDTLGGLSNEGDVMLFNGKEGVIVKKKETP